MQSQLVSLLSAGPTEGVDPSSTDPIHIAIVGCSQSTIVLWALSAEVALKAMYALESGKCNRQDHELAALFEKLECGTKSSLETRFQTIRRQRELYKDRTNSLENVLIEHNKDFVEWRYIYEKPGMKNQILDLKPAIEAILEEFENRDQPQNIG